MTTPSDTAPADSAVDVLASAAAIEALRGAFADTAVQHRYDDFVELFTEDGVWQIPDMDVEFTGRDAIRAGIEHMLGLWEFFVQTVHPGVVEADPAAPGDATRATGRSYVSEIGRFRDGGSQLNYAVYQDWYVRTDAGWKFARRLYRFLYVDTTPLPGKAPYRPAVDGPLA